MTKPGMSDSLELVVSMDTCMTQPGMSDSSEEAVMSDEFEKAVFHNHEELPRLLGSNPLGRLQRKEVKESTVSREMFIIDRNKSEASIQELYSMSREQIGEGAFGSVSLARNKTTGSYRAVKTMEKARLKSAENFKKEIQIMKLMDHPGIVKLYETFEDQTKVYLVMEVCRGGELFDKVLEVNSFTEHQAATLMQQAMRAVRHMHELRICHRDLKPENFLFHSKGPIETNTLKIIDFGLSARFTENEFLNTKVGTPYYVAPEVLSGRYNQAVDLWSCGIIMYILLCGYPPFCGKNEKEVLAKVKKGALHFKHEDWKGVSIGAQHLIIKLLNMDPKERCSAEQALNDDWIKYKAPKAAGKLEPDMLHHLRSFQASSHLKKAALTVIAGRLSEDEIAGLRETFVAIDLNGDGLLSISEMRAGLTKAGLCKLPKDFQKLMNDVDADGNGQIDYTEFLAAMLDKKVYLQESALWEAFSVFDLNQDGFIDPDELKRLLCDDMVDEAVGSRRIEEVMLQVDNNGDGTIDFAEFMNMMHENCSPTHRK